MSLVISEAIDCCDDAEAEYFSEPHWRAPLTRSGDRPHLWICTSCGNLILCRGDTRSLVTPEGLAWLEVRQPCVADEIKLAQRIVRAIRTEIPRPAGTFSIRQSPHCLIEDQRDERGGRGDPATQEAMLDMRSTGSPRPSRLGVIHPRQFLARLMRVLRLFTGAWFAPEPRTTDARTRRARRAA